MRTFEKSTKTQFHLEDSEIFFFVNPKIYPKDIIFKACYSLVDKIYIFLDSPCKEAIGIYLKTKEKSTKKQLEKLRDEFLNELVNASIRKNVAQRNQKIVELVVGGAIHAALTKPQSPLAEGEEDGDIQAIEKEIAALKIELEKEINENSKEDPR